MNKTFFVALGSVLVAASVWMLFTNRTLVPQAAAHAPETVSLADGDTLALEAGYVHKTLAGSVQRMLAYNGSVPGPTIRVQQGSTVTVRFTNNTDIPQLLHSHGVRMDNAYDGQQFVQDEMQPGEVFDYVLTFPDVGVYWYHPHAGEVYGQGRGLYGVFIVEPRDNSYWPHVNNDVPLILSDISLTDGVLDIEKDEHTHSLMGHFGDVQLLNGEEHYTLNAHAGDVVRLYIVNAANARPFNFAVDGLKLKRVGGDSGAYETAFMAESVVLGPSERAIVDVYVPTAGTYALQNKTPQRTYTLGTLRVDGTPSRTSYANEFTKMQGNADTVKTVAPFKKYLTAQPDKTIRLALDMHGMGGMGGMGGMSHGGMGGTMGGMGIPAGGIEWEDTMSMMNEMSNPDMLTWTIEDMATHAKNMDIMWDLPRSRPVKVRIINDKSDMHPMQHPIHFHGQRFVVLSRDGVPQTNLVWKDTVLVKAGETVDVVVDPTNPGIWMAHCHISEHLEAGMMFGFVVR